MIYAHVTEDSKFVNILLMIYSHVTEDTKFCEYTFNDLCSCNFEDTKFVRILLIIYAHVTLKILSLRAYF